MCVHPSNTHLVHFQMETLFSLAYFCNENEENCDAAWQGS